MEPITKILQDPGWWFTAVVVAGFVAIATAPAQKWATDRFYSWAGKKSDRLNELRKKKLADRDRAMAVLLENPPLLIVQILFITIQLLYVVGISIIGLVFFYIAATTSNETLRRISLVFVAIIVLQMLYFTFSGARKSLIMVGVFRKYTYQCFNKHDDDNKKPDGTDEPPNKQ